MDMNEYYKLLNNSTYIGNINTGQVLVEGMSQAQQAFKPMALGGKIEYNNNMYTEGTKAQSNYMNPQKLKDGEWR
jgi:hypothetical protein